MQYHAVAEIDITDPSRVEAYDASSELVLVARADASGAARIG